MMETTKAWVGNHDCVRCRLLLDRSVIRRILVQRIVNAVLAMVVHVITNQPPEMLLVQGDHMIKDLAATASDPSLGGSILPRCLNARPFRFQTRRLQKCNHLSVEFLRPAATPAGTPAPLETNTGAVPADNGFGVLATDNLREAIELS